ncbi:MAG: class I SAM-dependent methyltransferase [Deltaproteobacteria bacterium]|nr:class I SAM-dependent methyltransferase [Deltaproteobacteria bacterium]
MEAQLKVSRIPSLRLRTVADCVAPGAVVADIGTDHAQLLAWLRIQGRITAGLGIDIAAGPLAQARRTLAATRTEGVTLRQGDGLSVLTPGEVDTVTIAGMGGARVIRMVDAAAAVVERLTRLVLQPNSDWTAVRRWLAARGWVLHQERMVEDRGKFYVVWAIQPRPGPAASWTEDELHLGPRLLLERPPAFTAWLQRERARVDQALRRASVAGPTKGPRLAALRAHADRLSRALAPPPDC